MVAHDNLRFLKELDTAGGLFWKYPKHHFIHPSLTNGVSATTTDEPNLRRSYGNLHKNKPTSTDFTHTPPAPRPYFRFTLNAPSFSSSSSRGGSRSEPTKRRTENQQSTQTRHFDGRRLELGGELRAESANEVDGLRMGHEGSAGRVQVGAKVDRAAQVLLHRGGGGVRRVHLSAKGAELGEGDIAGAARGGCVGSHRRVGGHERGGALGGEVRSLGEKVWGRGDSKRHVFFALGRDFYGGRGGLWSFRMHVMRDCWWCPACYQYVVQGRTGDIPAPSVPTETLVPRVGRVLGRARCASP